MAKEINGLKKMIFNLANQISTPMAAISTMVIGKVHSIHRTFTKKTPAPTKSGNSNNTNNKQKQDKAPGPKNAQGGPSPPPPPATTPTPPKSWATVAKNGRPATQTNSPPPPPTPSTKSMIAHCSTDRKDDNQNLLHLHNNINQDLITAKAPKSLQVPGISWNQKRNMLRYTRSGFQNIDFDLHQATIPKTVQQADPLTLHVNKQETRYKDSIHGISIEDYPDTTNGIADLKRKLKFQNGGLKIATEPRYMTHSSKQLGKHHSYVIMHEMPTTRTRTEALPSPQGDMCYLR